MPTTSPNDNQKKDEEKTSRPTSQRRSDVSSFRPSQRSGPTLRRRLSNGRLDRKPAAPLIRKSRFQRGVPTGEKLIDQEYQPGAGAARRSQAFIDTNRLPDNDVVQPEPEPTDDSDQPDETALRKQPSAVSQGVDAIKDKVVEKGKELALNAAKKAALQAGRAALTATATAAAPYIGITLAIVGGIIVIGILIFAIINFAGGTDPANAGTSQVQPIDTNSNVDISSLNKIIGSGPMSKDTAEQLLVVTKNLRAQFSNNQAALQLLDQIDQAATTIINTTDPNSIAIQTDLLNTKIKELSALLPAGLRITAVATSLLGTPNTNYFENPRVACASFVSTVLKKAGILPNQCQIIRSATGLADKVLQTGATEVFPRGTAINETTIAGLQAGDLLFFNDASAGFKHSGIYVGNGDFIAISSSKGIVVKNKLISYPSYQQLAAYHYP